MTIILLLIKRYNLYTRIFLFRNNGEIALGISGSVSAIMKR